MKSCPWEPGNKYANCTEPRYNAISYTWGRFCLKPGEAGYTSTRPLRISNVPWPVPRVKPSCFTRDEMLNVVRTAAGASTAEDPVDFVWLDIACIDQTYPRNSDYFSEVGRQARIFRGADEVVIWLWAFDSASMSEWWTSIQRIEEPIIGIEVGNTPTIDPTEWIKHVGERLGAMRSDPWFSSLWTLQEAFLSPKATLMCKDGTTLTNPPGSNGPRSMLDLVHRWNEIGARLDRIKDVEKLWGIPLDQNELVALQTQISAIGFLESARQDAMQFQFYEGGRSLGSLADGMGNPLMLLAASHRRQCSEATDRVRGIMQVFDLQLGESSPNATPGKTYSLPELEDELGGALLQRYPISSLLIAQSRSCLPRKAWRISSDMTLMKSCHLFWRQQAAQSAPSGNERRIVSQSHGAEIATDVFEGVTMARFRGKYSRLSTFVDLMSEFVGPQTIVLQLDTKWEDRMRSMLSNQRQYLIDELTWLTNTLQDRNIGILFVARIRPPPQARTRGDVWCDWGVGLVLCQEAGRTDVYERIGVLIWDLWGLKDLMQTKRRSLQPTAAVADWTGYLDGQQSQGWVPIHSYFG
ncbi:hypothetical protein PG993_003127 [Apiospora rasikravindrae]|uniref:Heterokaryon incompatibility domain-containing protein n=1 Tax=Apiospora rasikravindrae TaxID=990691 RepID=A0ABR1TZ26_9PEZI